jgi:DNA-binding NarL/FixJ family response regulator
MSDTGDTSIIRVLVADDNAMMREALRTVLSSYPSLHVVGEAQNGEEAVQLVSELAPSVVLMDINMPKLNGIEATRRIKQQYPHVAIVGLSVDTAQVHRDLMAKAGATTILSKEAAVEQLYPVIEASIQRGSTAMQ